jgi:hypothetical protein
VDVWDVLGKRSTDDDFVVVGGIKAPDVEMALLLARETHFRHKEGVAYAVRRRGEQDLHVGPVAGRSGREEEDVAARDACEGAVLPVDRADAVAVEQHVLAREVAVDAHGAQPRELRRAVGQRLAELRARRSSELDGPRTNTVEPCVRGTRTRMRPA